MKPLPRFDLCSWQWMLENSGHQAPDVKGTCSRCSTAAHPKPRSSEAQRLEVRWRHAERDSCIDASAGCLKWSKFQLSRRRHRKRLQLTRHATSATPQRRTGRRGIMTTCGRGEHSSSSMIQHVSSSQSSPPEHRTFAVCTCPPSAFALSRIMQLCVGPSLEILRQSVTALHTRCDTITSAGCSRLRSRCETVGGLMLSNFQQLFLMSLTGCRRRRGRTASRPAPPTSHWGMHGCTRTAPPTDRSTERRWRRAQF